MHIYFVGAHGAGKTSCVRYVSEKYKIPMITEVARQVMAEMELSLEKLRTNLELVNLYQKQVFLRQVTIEREHQGSFVSDRAFDNLAYAAEHATILRDLLAHKECKWYFEWIKQGIFFFVRPYQSFMVEDGMREKGTWEAVVRIDGMIKFLLEMAGVKYFNLAAASFQERVRLIDFVLSSYTIE